MTPDQLNRLEAVIFASKTDFESLALASGLNPTTDFRNADWSQVDFGSANLAGYDFTGANITDADFSGTDGLDQANFKRTIGWKTARWPIGFHPMRRIRLSRTPESNGIDEVAAPTALNTKKVAVLPPQVRLYSVSGHGHELDYEMLRHIGNRPAFGIESDHGMWSPNSDHRSVAHWLRAEKNGEYTISDHATEETLPWLVFPKLTSKDIRDIEYFRPASLGIAITYLMALREMHEDVKFLGVSARIYRVDFMSNEDRRFIEANYAMASPFKHARWVECLLRGMPMSYREGRKAIEALGRSPGGTRARLGLLDKSFAPENFKPATTPSGLPDPTANWALPTEGRAPRK